MYVCTFTHLACTTCHTMEIVLRSWVFGMRIVKEKTTERYLYTKTTTTTKTIEKKHHQKQNTSICMFYTRFFGFYFYFFSLYVFRLCHRGRRCCSRRRRRRQRYSYGYVQYVCIVYISHWPTPFLETLNAMYYHT